MCVWYSLVMLRPAVTIIPLGLLAILLVMGNAVGAAESQTAQSQQAEPGRGLTVNDLTRGVRSAAQNIEKEIPKIGAAVGKTLKSIGSNNSEKPQDRPQPPDKK
jgi:hypothetical protein